MLILFVLKNLAVLLLLLASAAAAGTLVMGAREGIAFRSALGFALCAHACFVLGVIGQLRAVPIIALIILIGAGAVFRLRRERVAWGVPIIFAIGSVPLFLLALYPPIAFDETLYHLPFVRGFALEGGLRFLPDVRFPVF